MPRLFTAVDPSETVRDQLQQFCTAREVPFDTRWTPPDNYHITLRFIGNVSDEQAADVQSVLKEVTADPFTLQPLGLGVLPSRRNPRVLIVKIEASDPLRTLYQAVEDTLADVGVERENRSYRPHLTIARLKNAHPEQVHEFVRSAPELSLDPFPIDAFILYESTLRPSGALHEPRATFELRNST